MVNNASGSRRSPWRAPGRLFAVFPAIFPAIFPKIFLAALTALAAPAPALAQDGFFSGLQFWFQDRPQRPPQALARPPQARRLAPRRALRKPTPLPARPAQRAAPASGREGAAGETATPVGVPVTVFGDSLAIQLGQALQEARAEPDPPPPAYHVERKAKESSGLTREDFYDWPRAVETWLGSGAPAGVAVFFVGANDRQEIRVGGDKLEPLSPRWREIYAARVGRIAEAFRKRAIPLLWVGLPPMKSEKFSADMRRLSDIHREAVEKAGGRFLDIGDAFSDESGRYVDFGPSVGGQTVKLRAGDGVHFTRAGALKLAHFVALALRPMMTPAQPAPGAAPSTEPPRAAPAQGEPAQVERPQVERPPIGPVRSLTEAPSAPLSDLATPSSSLAAPSVQPAASDEARRESGRRAGAPPQGRGDDFVWPPASAPAPRQGAP